MVFRRVLLKTVGSRYWDHVIKYNKCQIVSIRPGSRNYKLADRHDSLSLACIVVTGRYFVVYLEKNEFMIRETI